MPRKIYDLPKAESEEEEHKIDHVRCADEKCDFFFDLGTNEQKLNAAQKHNLLTGHEVITEYV